MEENKKEKEKADKTILELAKNYINMESVLVNQLMIQTPNHYLTTGTYREEIWKSLFEAIIPKKYCIEQSVFIIDSNGNISKEVDLAVFDEMYTPYIFKYGKIKFIPIEAVAIVIQCKSKIGNDRDLLFNLREWTESINRLETSLDSVARTMTDVQDNKVRKKDFEYTQTATRPIKILCATMVTIETGDLETLFDFILHISSDRKRLIKKIKNEDSDFSEWYYSLNHFNPASYDGISKEEERVKKQIKNINSERKLTNLRIADKYNHENVIMSLIFQLNQILMLINNPMLFPHAAYVKGFNNIFRESDINFSE
ncbi:DUF6602 domain-containing protein [Clostridium sp. Marseille-P2415]|uniref:DUF6602 domain-containing protein n=1 Tax=Clostridium sp. Marseille-P2415 TaxID=1805471 RepID=UPI0009886968|nr:DUF6602 domain-containing protein [Clostridium sp. Marseille-P2415]